MRNVVPIALASSVLMALIAPTADADAVAIRGVASKPNGGNTAYASGAAHGSRGTFRGVRAASGDGQGNAWGTGGSAFSTSSGAQGARGATFERSADGTVSANARSGASGVNGSYERSGSFNKSADGNASGTRNTTVNNANTGVTMNGSTTYTKGEGVSRTASCKDASGNSVTCGSR
jgi:hypothetical protein